MASSVFLLTQAPVTNNSLALVLCPSIRSLALPLVFTRNCSGTCFLIGLCLGFPGVSQLVITLAFSISRPTPFAILSGLCRLVQQYCTSRFRIWLSLQLLWLRLAIQLTFIPFFVLFCTSFSDLALPTNPLAVSCDSTRGHSSCC